MPVVNKKTNSLKFPKKILEESLGVSVITISQIKPGNDGEKFAITTKEHGKLFCRIKDISNREELPYQEADVLGKVKSKYLVKPLHVDRIKNRYVLVTPYIDGENLAEHLNKVGTLTDSETRKLALILFETIQSLSEAHIVHFDIKPENIMVDSTGTYRLVDFGAARFAKKMRGEKIYPARRYIAPEVLSHLFEPSELTFQSLSHLSDMYGVGAVLYQSITGRKISDVLTSSSDILQKSLAPVLEHKPNANKRLSTVIDRLLLKDPTRRFSPREAIAILEGREFPRLETPMFFLKTKPGSGGEHGSLLKDIVENGNEVGIYWRSGLQPSFPKKTVPTNLIWETVFPETPQEIENDLLKQYQRGVLALCVPGKELRANKLEESLKLNLEAFDQAIDWRNEKAPETPILVVIELDSALLSSGEIKKIRSAYYQRDVEGIILRLSVPAGSLLDETDLDAIRSFISPWADKDKTVLLEGDISTIPLVLFGVSSLVSTTHPKLYTSESRRVKPKFSRRPDRIYMPKFLSMLTADSVILIRRSSQLGKLLTNCYCPHCINLKNQTTGTAWTRTDRRKHFVYIFPNELAKIKRGGVKQFKKAVSNAETNTKRFSRTVSLNNPHLHIWQAFL